MVASMTGYARQSVEENWGSATWELRSVNHRFLDVSVRMPEELRALESTIRDRVSSKLKRGKVDCTLRFETRELDSQSLQIDESALSALLDAIKSVQAGASELAPPTALDVLRWPGVVKTDRLDLDSLKSILLKTLDSAVTQLSEMRKSEGLVLAEGMSTRCAQCADFVKKLRERVPEILADQSAKLRARIEELSEDADPGRIEQELAIMANRMDVAEEIDRLEAHIAEVARTLEKREPIGRRLDFLMQEMNREANTIGSKSAHIDSTGVAIELKVLIEQMREQVQNIE